MSAPARVTFLAPLFALAVVRPLFAAVIWHQSDFQVSSRAGSSLCFNGAHSIAVAANGHIHICWTDTHAITDSMGLPVATGAEVFYRKRDGTSWSSAVQISRDEGQSPIRSDSPTLALDANQKPWAVWDDYRHGNSELYFSRWSGTEWTADERLTESAGSALEPSVVVDGSGRVHVVWTDTRDEGVPEVYYKRWTGTTWSSDSRISPEDGKASMSPSIAADHHDSLHVVWTDARGTGAQEVYYRRYSPYANTWRTDERISADDEIASEFPCVAVDGAGTVHVVWGNDAIWYRRWEDGWGSEVSLTSSEGYNPSIAVDSLDRLHVVWFAQP